MRQFMLLCGLLSLLGAIWYFRLRPSGEPTVPRPGDSPEPIIIKQPVTVQHRTFDPANPPADMPPLPPGEQAECESNFGLNAIVSGQARKTVAGGTVTVTQVKVILQLEITIWTPDGVSQHVLEHEEGHRQIAEHYYETADMLAEQIAEPYIGKQVSISSDNRDAQLNEVLQQMGSEITAEYNKELHPNAAQLRFDTITDHAISDIDTGYAVEQALRDTAPAPSPPTE